MPATALIVPSSPTPSVVQSAAAPGSRAYRSAAKPAFSSDAVDAELGETADDGVGGAHVG